MSFFAPPAQTAPLPWPVEWVKRSLDLQLAGKLPRLFGAPGHNQDDAPHLHIEAAKIDGELVAIVICATGSWAVHEDGSVTEAKQRFKQ